MPYGKMQAQLKRVAYDVERAVGLCARAACRRKWRRCGAPGGRADVIKAADRAKKLSQNREDPRYVVVSNMSWNPYDTVGISLILLVDETQNKRVTKMYP